MSDIAAKLQVSTVTVSKALSGQKGVSEGVREQIVALAEEMGYEPVGSGHKNGLQKSYQIGVFISARYLSDHTSFYWKMYQEIADYAMRKSCFTLFESLTEEMEKEKKLPHLLEEKKVDGIVVVGKPGYDYDHFLRKQAEVPVVFLDFYSNESSVDSFISDGFYGTYLLTDYLLRKGFQKIAYVGTLYATQSITDRYLGYTKALMEHQIIPRKDYLIDDRDVSSGLRDDYSAYVLPEEMPEAFVCNCDFIASLLIRNLREKGLRIPEDISVVGFDNFLNPALCDIELTTYAVDIQAMANKAVKALIQKMNGEKLTGGIHIVEGYLVEGDSVKKHA